MGRNRSLLFALLLPILAIGIFAYARRGDVREWWFEINRPNLPQAVKFTPPPTSEARLTNPEPSVVEGGVATSKNYTLVSSPTPSTKSKKRDPFEPRGPLPSEANLAVPFMSQAPTGDWNLPYQEACEEASAIMVHAYYRGETGKIYAATAKKRIDDLVAFEKKFFGYYEDTTAADTAKFIKAYFHYSDVIVTEWKDPDEIRRAIANGYPVLVPAAGRLLGNPNYRNNGPLYHMLVVKGYTRDRFITNDPGTRRGADYTYDSKTLLNAAHDWNGGKVTEGKRLMIIVLPRAEAL